MSESPVIITLANCTNTLLSEIAMPEMKRRDIAQTYRMAMNAEQHAGEKVDWRAVNQAIIARWSFSALTWIKEQAHSGKCFEPKKGKS